MLGLVDFAILLTIYALAFWLPTCPTPTLHALPRSYPAAHGASSDNRLTIPDYIRFNGASLK
jgi:hypothetical protein